MSLDKARRVLHHQGLFHSIMQLHPVVILAQEKLGKVPLENGISWLNPSFELITSTTDRDPFHCLDVCVREGEGFPSAVLALQGKVPWPLGAKDSHEVTPHNKPHTGDLLGRKISGSR